MRNIEDPKPDLELDEDKLTKPVPAILTPVLPNEHTTNKPLPETVLEPESKPVPPKRTSRT